MYKLLEFFGYLHVHTLCNSAVLLLVICYRQSKKPSFRKKALCKVWADKCIITEKVTGGNKQLKKGWKSN